MPRHVLKFHPEADAEVVEALTWHAERSERAAEGFLEELDRAIALVLETPQRWPLARNGSRRFLLHRYPFAIIYREIGDAIEIVAVAHARRRPHYWRSRLE